MSISVDIEKNLGSFHLRVAFEAENETMALLGASGCGKSMTLRCIAGIVRPDRGRIMLNGRTLFDSEQHIDLPPQQRGVGYPVSAVRPVPAHDGREECLRRNARGYAHRAEGRRTAHPAHARAGGAGAAPPGESFGRSAAARCARPHSGRKTRKSRSTTSRFRAR